MKYHVVPRCNEELHSCSPPTFRPCFDSFDHVWPGAKARPSCTIRAKTSEIIPCGCSEAFRKAFQKPFEHD